MAPEMISSGDAPYVGAAVDVWSCGAMLYVMVCCAYP
jgi:serine/threonine protein kinase